jgi:hypothetical protein
MRYRPWVTGLAVAAGVLVPVSAAMALTSFVTPSRNIGCIGDKTEVRCDIKQTSGTPPPRPANCEQDWGSAYSVRPTGKGRGVCAGDTVLPSPGQAGVKVIAYGKSIRFGKITCISKKTGMTCRNTSAHGFTLSREAIRIF